MKSSPEDLAVQYAQMSEMEVVGVWASRPENMDPAEKKRELCELLRRNYTLCLC